MHQHQQTIADLERQSQESPLTIAVYAAVLLAGMACALLFAFTI